MKTRLIVAGIGLPLMFVMLLLLPAWVTAAAVALVCALAAYELLWATGQVKNPRIVAVSAIMAVLICAWRFGREMLGLTPVLMQVIVFVYIAYLFGELLAAETKLDFRLICLAMFGGLVIPYMLSAVSVIISMEHGRYLIFAPFVMTMVPDSGAYFVGRACGKHKLAPVISPNKTVEGAIGGMVTGVLAMVIYGVILQQFGFTVNYLYAAIYGLLGTIGSVGGDLVFSTIKRQQGVKDFGNLLPGHGGALDRFDSTTVVAPLTELLLLLIPFAVK